MTTGVIVMNKSGVALAADTLMTFTGSGVQGSRPRHQKLFALSDEQPLAIMVYNRTRLMGCELAASLIPRFKTVHGRDRLRDVEEWASCFQDFVAAHVRPSEQERSKRLGDFVEELALEVLQTAETLRCRYAVVGRLQPVADDLKAAIELLEIEARETAEVLTVKEVAAMKREIPAQRKEGAAATLELAGLGRDFARLVGKRLRLAIPSGQHCGVVIAGYGDDQDVPSFVDTIFEGDLGPVAKTFRNATIDIASHGPVCVEAFAQRDMVDTFLNGMDREMRAEVEGLMIRGACDVASDAAVSGRPSAKGAIGRAVDASILSFDTSLDRIQRSMHRDRILTLVNVMDRHDLADFANALVYSSIMRHDYRVDPPTVGGGIDVALMSRAQASVDLRLSRR